MKNNYGLELYKLIVIPNEDHKDISHVEEFGWINDEQFCVWVSYVRMNDFLKRLIEIFGNCLFDNGGFEANMQEDVICMDLSNLLEGYVEIEELFPKDEYIH